MKTPGSLLKEYNLDGNGTESNGSSPAGEQLTNETEVSNLTFLSLLLQGFVLIDNLCENIINRVVS